MWYIFWLLSLVFVVGAMIAYALYREQTFGQSSQAFKDKGGRNKAPSTSLRFLKNFAKKHGFQREQSKINKPADDDALLRDNTHFPPPIKPFKVFKGQKDFPLEEPEAKKKDSAFSGEALSTSPVKKSDQSKKKTKKPGKQSKDI